MIHTLILMASLSFIWKCNSLLTLKYSGNPFRVDNLALTSYGGHVTMKIQTCHPTNVTTTSSSNQIRMYTYTANTTTFWNWTINQLILSTGFKFSTQVPYIAIATKNPGGEYNLSANSTQNMFNTHFQSSVHSYFMDSIKNGSRIFYYFKVKNSSSVFTTEICRKIFGVDYCPSFLNISRQTVGVYINQYKLLNVLQVDPSQNLTILNIFAQNGTWLVNKTFPGIGTTNFIQSSFNYIVIGINNSLYTLDSNTMQILWSITVPSTFNTIKVIYPWVCICFGSNNSTFRQYHIITGRYFHYATYNLSQITMHFDPKNPYIYTLSIGSFGSIYYNQYDINDEYSCSPQLSSSNGTVCENGYNLTATNTCLGQYVNNIYNLSNSTSNLINPVPVPVNTTTNTTNTTTNTTNTTTNTTNTTTNTTFNTTSNTTNSTTNTTNISSNTSYSSNNSNFSDITNTSNISNTLNTTNISSSNNSNILNNSISNNTNNTNNYYSNSTNSSNYVNQTYFIIPPYFINNMDQIFCSQRCKQCSITKNNCTKCAKFYTVMGQGYCDSQTNTKVATLTFATINAFKSAKMMGFYAFMHNFDLYDYHKLNYDGILKEVLDFTRFMKDKQWELVPINPISDSYDEIWFQKLYYLPFTNTNFTNSERKDLTFLENTKQYFTLFIPTTVIFFVLFNRLFYLFFKLKISQIFRSFAFWMHLFGVILFSDIERFSYLGFMQISTLFHHDIQSKVLQTFSLCFLGIWLSLCLGFYFLCYSFYGSKSLYFFANMRISLPSATIMTIKYVYKPIIQGFIHILFWEFPSLQLFLLSFMEIASFCTFSCFQLKYLLIRSKRIFAVECLLQLTTVVINALLYFKYIQFSPQNLDNIKYHDNFNIRQQTQSFIRTLIYISGTLLGLSIILGIDQIAMDLIHRKKTIQQELRLFQSKNTVKRSINQYMYHPQGFERKLTLNSQKQKTSNIKVKKITRNFGKISMQKNLRYRQLCCKNRISRINEQKNL